MRFSHLLCLEWLTRVKYSMPVLLTVLSSSSLYGSQYSQLSHSSWLLGDSLEGRKGFYWASRSPSLQIISPSACNVYLGVWTASDRLVGSQFRDGRLSVGSCRHVGE